MTVLEYAREINCPAVENASMHEYTTFKTGGPAEILLLPDNEEQLISVLKFCKSQNITPFVLGKGSNLLVSDNGISTVVIHLGNGFDYANAENETVRCGAAMSMSRLCRFALSKSLSGLEFAFGIPGSVGGAVYMNAGAYGGEMKDVLVSCTYVTLDGEKVTLSADQMELGYRTSVFGKTPGVIIEAELKLVSGEKSEIQAKMEDFLNRRKSKQPLEYPSAGSTFKRPEGYFAGALIEQCSLKGFSVGGAQVSEKHAGFVINRSGATSQDIIDLIREVQRIVLNETGVKLEPEVKMLGF